MSKPTLTDRLIGKFIVADAAFKLPFQDKLVGVQAGELWREAAELFGTALQYENGKNCFFTQQRVASLTTMGAISALDFNIARVERVEAVLSKWRKACEANLPTVTTICTDNTGEVKAFWGEAFERLEAALKADDTETTIIAD